MSKKHLLAGMFVCLAFAGTTVWAQSSPSDAVAQAVASNEAFPTGTSVVSVTVDGENAVVDLSVEAAPAGLGDTQSDAMVKAIVDALGEWPEITAIEVTVAGKALWEYLPRATVGEAAPAAPAAPMMRMMAMSAPSGPTSSELDGKLITLHPSHGAYASSTSWYRAMRTLCGPNPSPPRPAGWTGSTYQPSNYYFWTMGYQWDSFYEDDMSPETIRFLEAYLKSSGAEVWVGRNLDKNAGNFDAVGYGYPAAPFTLPKWMTACKYYLQDRGDVPEWVWNTTDVTGESNIDLRARAYYSNYRMAQKYPGQDQSNPDVYGNCLSFSLHSNAAGSGTARGTETYWYTSVYPYLQTPAKAYCAAVEAKVISAIKTKYDGIWAEAMYPKGTTRVEWPSGTYRGYDQDGVSTGTTGSGWQDRGVKTSNFGEIRECKMPAQLMELAFHDDWKFYPDHVFMMDQIWRSTVAWGIYEGMCQYWGIAPKAQKAATLVSADFPAWVKPNDAIAGAVTMQNLGQAWCWGNKFDAATMVYGPYTVWKLAATANDQFVPGSKIEVAADAMVYPGDSETFAVALTAPAAEGTYTTEWQMLKDDAFGGAFGDVATAQISVDGTPPVITIGSPAAMDYPYGCVTIAFEATDAGSGLASVTGTLDGQPVTSEQSLPTLALGAHTLVVTAVDVVGNTATESVTFNVVNAVGKFTGGGWIPLADKKGSFSVQAAYATGGSAPSGDVNYQDHGTKMRVESDQIVALGVIGNQAIIGGTCTIDGEPGHTFQVVIVDNGEPGRQDVFQIFLDTGYVAGGTIGGGNIQMH